MSTSPDPTAPRRKAKLAGVFYLITFVTGACALFGRSGLGTAAGIVAGLSYVVVTVLLYVILKPVNRGLSLIAAIVSLLGCSIPLLSLVVRLPQPNNISLVCFGVYCLLLGYLIFRSTFLPRVVGALMGAAGLGWLSFASPAFARDFFPYVLLPGMIGEGALMLWLLIFGVDGDKWVALANRR